MRRYTYCSEWYSKTKYVCRAKSNSIGFDCVSVTHIIDAYTEDEASCIFNEMLSKLGKHIWSITISDN